MKTTYIVINCDECTNIAEHFTGKPNNKRIRKSGWIIVGKKHLCNYDCYTKFIKKKEEST